MAPRWPPDPPPGRGNSAFRFHDGQNIKHAKVDLPSGEGFGSQDGPKTSQLGAKMESQMDQKIDPRCGTFSEWFLDRFFNEF